MRPHAMLLAALLFAPTARAESPAVDAPPPVDVALREQAPVRRVLSLQWNPVALFLSRLSVDVVIAPIDHHALVLSPMFAWPSTVPLQITNPMTMTSTTIASQQFFSFGGEVGYRYYTGLGGARGFFLGPSLLAAYVDAKDGNGHHAGYATLGFAVDAGFGALLGDRLAITLGVGVQYKTPLQSIPAQQWPANVTTNENVLPRVLLAVGWAL